MSRARTFADLATASEAGSLANRNMVINGDMAVHQRVNPDTHNDKAVDQIQLIKNNLDTADFTTKHQLITDNPPFSDALEIKCTTADTSIGANELIYLAKKFEAQNLQHLSFGSSLAKTTTLSFHVKSNLTGTFSVGLVTQDGTARNIGSTYTIDSANTWEKKSITFDGDTSATIANDNGHGLDMTFILAAGSNWTGTANSSWANYAGGRLAHGHNVNIASSTSNEFYITGIQWEVGSVATPFEHESFDTNLHKCYRYYQKSYNYEANPGTATNNGELGNDGNGSSGNSTGQMIAYDTFYTEMRTTPTITLYDIAGTSGKVSTTKHGTNEYNGETGNVFRAGSKNYSIDRPATGNSANSIRWFFEASAEF